MQSLTERVYRLSAFNELKALVERSRPLHLRRIPGSFRAFISSYVHKELRRPLLYIANSLESAEQIHDDLEQICGKDYSAFLPGLSTEPYDAAGPRPELVSVRLEAMQKFLEKENWLAVCSPEALMEKLPLPEQFLDRQIYLKTGNHYTFEELLEQFAGAGFERVDIVEQVGEFAVRGGIIDIFAWNSEEPIRMEFFGDELESLRSFDVISQRTTGALQEIVVLPHLAEQNAEVFLPSLLPDNAVVFFEDKAELEQKLNAFFDQAAERFAADPTLAMSSHPPDDLYQSVDALFEQLRPYQHLSSDLVAADGVKTIDFKIQVHPDFNGNIKLFLEYLRKQAAEKRDNHFIIQSASAEQATRLREIIEEEEIEIHASFPVGTLHGGFVSEELGLQVLTDHEVFKRFKRHKVYRSFKSGAYLRQLGGLHIYDYVVHVDYGIGQYLGLEVVNYGNVDKECLKIAYADGDSLFVTVDRLNRVQKYSSEDGVSPKLTKLGTKEWEKAKARTKESLKKVAAELIQIYAGRKAQSGFTFEADNHWQRELEASFPFEETEDQNKAIFAVKQDMENGQPMDRLLCGDVGFGKTEVALRAAFKSVMSGKQVAVLVPTTILAFQHNETFSQRLKPFPVRVEMLNRFRSPKEQKQVLAGLADGSVDIVIGTHRLISEDVHFKDLGLLVVDEEQRFGVKHKEKLKKYRLSVDILSMTATPIPRTLHMALMGARDFSNIETPPRNRMPVHTEIIHWNDTKIHHVIKREIQRGGQIYFVHNRVETIEAMRQTLAEIIPEARIAVGHGQLPEKRLEKVMLDFMARRFDILVASMIIENGLDIPNVNTIIINRAHKFGLAQLYQLRGRVGRSDKQAYAYLLVPPMDKLTELSRKRLRTIQDFTELGSGYKVALRDLEIRGAGNLLGKQQSGFVQTVGFDLYCKILEDAVEELQQSLSGELREELAEKEPRRAFTDPKLDVDFDLLIPESYIKNELERVAIYHRLVNFRKVEQIEQMADELRDRFGKIPEEVELFFRAIELKVLAGNLYAVRLAMGASKMKIFFDPVAQEDDMFFEKIIPGFMNQKMAQVHFLNQKELGLEIVLQGSHSGERLDFVKKLLQSIDTKN